jgi:1-acyl-sn-glycerol-3-phosphate acyltransferase
VLRLIGLTVRVRGRAHAGGPVLFAANHVSYLDILALGSLLDGRFIAKAEVRSWPGFGLLARVSGTRFIQRIATQAEAQTEDLARLLREGRSLILFAEGTSSDGCDVLAFKSALFGVVERTAVTVQPVAIRYTHLNGMPATDATRRNRLAWYGDMTLMPHLWTFLGQRGAVAELHVLEPLAHLPENGRKALARAAEHAVRNALRTP